MKESFTLIELIVVIAIIAVLAAVIAPQALKAIEKAKISKTAADFKSTRTAAHSYYTDIGAWPWKAARDAYETTGLPEDDYRNDNGTGFVDDDGSVGWDGPYLAPWPKAEWITSNTSFKYFCWFEDWDLNGVDESHLVWLGNETTSETVPVHVRVAIDEILDDGNLSTGRVRMYGPWFNLIIVD